MKVFMEAVDMECVMRTQQILRDGTRAGYGC